MVWLRCQVITLILMLVFSLIQPARAIAIDTPVSISGPAFPGIAPVTVKFKVQIQANPDNRFACLVMDSADFYRSTCWQLDEPNRITWWIEFKDIPAGVYVVIVAVTRSDKSIRRASMQMEVLEGLPKTR